MRKIMNLINEAFDLSISGGDDGARLVKAYKFIKELAVKKPELDVLKAMYWAEQRFDVKLRLADTLDALQNALY